MTTFAGLPVTGEIDRGSSRKDQRPLAEFTPLVQALLDDPYVVEFGWTQYTPYFNDGDPCIFRANEIWVRTQDDVSNEYYDEYKYELEVDYGHPSLGSFTYHWEGEWGNGTRHQVNDGYKPVEGKGDHSTTLLAAQALSEAVVGGEFDNVLLEAFGDHAEVTVTRDGISVNSYEHD